MPVQSVPTKLTLAQWAQIMGINPLHFFGVTLPDAMLRGTCDVPWFQSSWQDFDRVSRDEVAQAIAEAEGDIEALTGYRLAPSWESDEWRPTTRPYRAALFNTNNRGLRGFQQTVELQWGYLIAGGIRSVTPLFYAAEVTYANTIPPEAYDDQATCGPLTITTAIPPCEIAVYYPGHMGDERWRIRPVSVEVIGDAYTLRFARAQALIPAFLDTYDLSDLRGADGTVDANFLASVDVARVFNDPQQQATLLWESLGTCGSCGGSGCPSCGYAQQTACLMVRNDPRLSLAVPSPAVWNPSTLSFDPRGLAFARQPDLARFWYYAGWRDQSLACPTAEMDADWARIVAYYAASKLARPPCACSKSQWSYWSADLAFASGAEELASYNISASDLESPLGTRRGALHAWRRLHRHGAIIQQGTYS